MSHRLLELRRLMKSKEFFSRVIDGYIVPSTDPHRNEYVPNKYKRREFISNFTGSAGTALITDDKALLWTDGRYFLQAESELDKNDWTLMREGQTEVLPLKQWIVKNFQEKSVIGIDPELISIDEWNSWKDLFDQSDLDLVAVETNLIDLIWSKERPSLPDAKIWIYPEHCAGMTIDDKIELLRRKFKENQVEHLIVDRNDDIAWLFNVRGGDIDFNPVFFSFAIVSLDSVRIYLDQKKVSDEVRRHLEESNVLIRPYEHFYDDLRSIASSNDVKDKYSVSPTCNTLVQKILGKKRLLVREDPIYLLKSKKNPSEIEGMKRAHVKDGVALSCFLQWIEEKIDEEQEITELTCVEQLRQLRSEQENFLYESFESICGFGSNGSIIHYRPNEKSNKTIDRSSLFLVDSGGQYLEGTTDVTRTIHLGQPSKMEKECFTRVLKGMISLSRSVFPRNTVGARLDSFARRFLWDVGLDYPHGTGHGVGCCLNVHEGPQSIGTRVLSETSLAPGMVLSNEPGFYLKEKFGIRIENCIVVVENKNPLNMFTDGQSWLTFEQLTLVPIQLKLIDTDLLDRDEKTFINDYHRQVREIISDEMNRLQLEEKYLRWIEENTRPID